MDLRKQTIIIIALVSICLIGGLGLFSQVVILDGFVALEEEHLEETIDRTIRTIDLDRRYLLTSVHDWAMWDDTYLYVQGLSPDYAQKNLQDSVFGYFNLRSIIYTGIDGDIVYARGFDPLLEEEVPIPPSLYHLLCYNGSDDLSGIVDTDAGPMLIAVNPILQSSGEGPVMGSLLFARNIDEAWVQELSELVGVEMQLSPLPHDQDTDRPPLLISRDPDTITGSQILTDIFGDPVLLLTVTQHRSIYMKGLLSYQSALIAIAGFGLLSGVLLYLLINRSFLRRIATLNREVQQITKRQKTGVSVCVLGDDELARLAHSINGMLRSLEDDQLKIRESEERYRLLFNSAIDPILLVALDSDLKPGIILDANKAVLSILGISDADLIGMRLSRVFAIDKADTSTDRTFVFGHFHPLSGDYVPVEVGMHTFFLNGQAAAIRVARDISERVRIEEERQASIEQIGQNIEQFAIIGDNIRNPLQVIRGYLSLIEDEEYTWIIDDQIERIDDRIRQLDEGWLESENVINFLRRNRN